MRSCGWIPNIALWLVAGLVIGCNGAQETSRLAAAYVDGSAQRGKATIAAYQCGKCHTIPGVRKADGVVGPPLAALSQRTYIAGNFPNTAQNLEKWIMDPQAMKPATAMPDLGLSDRQSRDVTAYLETLK